MPSEIKEKEINGEGKAKEVHSEAMDVDANSAGKSAMNIEGKTANIEGKNTINNEGKAASEGKTGLNTEGKAAEAPPSAMDVDPFLGFDADCNAPALRIQGQLAVAL